MQNWFSHLTVTKQTFHHSWLLHHILKYYALRSMSIPDRHTGLLLEVLSDLKILVRITTSYGKQKWKSEFVYFQMTILRHQPPLQTRKYCVSYTYFKASRPFEQPCSKPVHKNQIPIYTYQVYRSRNLTIDLISQIVIVCFSYNSIVSSFFIQRIRVTPQIAEHDEFNYRAQNTLVSELSERVS